MAEKKPSGFRFRLPWLLQPALPPHRESPTQPPRTATQTSVTSTPAQRPPFRPPGKAPAPAPVPPLETVASPAPFSPKRSPPQSVASTPPMSASPKSSVPKSTAKTIEPDASRPTKETQATIGILVPSTTPQTPPSSPPRQAQPQPSQHQTPPPPPSVSPKLSANNFSTANTIDSVASQPAKETQNTTETIPTAETAGPALQAQSQPSPPQTPPPAKQSQTHTRTPPNSPSQLASEPGNKASSLPSPPTKTTMGNHLAMDEKPRERTELRGTQTKSMDLHSMDLKSQKPKLTATRVPLHREIKDDISKFIHKIGTSSAKQSTDEKPANIITIAGDNTGASMRLSLDEVKRGYKLNNDTTAHDSSINGDGSSRRDSKSDENKEPKAIVNSNIQGINNSMMFNSCVTERNPGVHLGLYRNPANINDSTMKNTESVEMQRAEVNITPPQKLVYDPTMEASEFEFEEDDSKIEVL